jgi:hypothetical protein
MLPPGTRVKGYRALPWGGDEHKSQMGNLLNIAIHHNVPLSRFLHKPKNLVVEGVQRWGEGGGE